MLVERVAVGHAGDEVGDRGAPAAAVPSLSAGRASPAGRSRGLAEIAREQLAHHALGLAHHPA